MQVRLGFALALSLLASSLIPAAAQAASVFTHEIDDPDYELGIVFDAAAGEVNRLFVRDLDGGALLTQVVEANAPLTVLPECVAMDDTGSVAACPAGPMQVDLGDHADIARIAASSPFRLLLVAGEGDDDVVASSSENQVSGGGGDDRIRLGDAIAFGTAERRAWSRHRARRPVWQQTERRPRQRPAGERNRERP